MTYLPLVIAILSVISPMGLLRVESAGMWPLTVIHFNDLHARFEETSPTQPICQGAGCVGGFARLYAAVEDLKRTYPDALVLVDGDSYHGTYWYSLMKWDVVQYFLNLMPIDAHSIGNHEFIDGVRGLAPLLRHLRAPSLAANMDTSDEPSLQGLYKPYIVLERSGRKIGIIGISPKTITQEGMAGRVRFSDEAESARKYSAVLAEQGVDVIILLSHGGITVDRKIASECGENIDIIVSGHSHNIMQHGTDPMAVYPEVVRNFHTGHTVLIVQAYAFSMYVGNLTAWFDDNGEIVAWDGKPLHLTKEYRQDPNILRMMWPLKQVVDFDLNRVVGSSLVRQTGENCAEAECMLGDVVCDAMIAEGYKTTVNKEPVVCLMSRGYLFASLPLGVLTLRDLQNALPYSSTRVEVLHIKGQYLLEAMERSMAAIWSRQPFSSPDMLQVGGMSVIFNISMPVNHRVAGMWTRDLDGRHTPLDVNKYYRLVTIQYFTNGDGTYSMISSNQIDTTVISFNVIDVLRNYLQYSSPLCAPAGGRITLLN